MNRLGLLAAVGLAALLLAMLVLALRLPDIPEGATVDLSWARWAAFAVPVLSFAAIFWLRKIKGPIEPGTDPAMLASLALMMLGSLIPDLGQHAVPLDAAIDLGMVAFMLAGIIAINLGEAWKKPGRTRLNNPTQPGTTA